MSDPAYFTTCTCTLANTVRLGPSFSMKKPDPVLCWHTKPKPANCFNSPNNKA